MILESDSRDRGEIVRDLESSDEEVRRLAVERLFTLPSSEAIPYLVDCLGDTGWRVRKAAVARLIYASDSPEVVDALLDCLADGDNSGRRNSAVEALIGMGPLVLPRVLRDLETEVMGHLEKSHALVERLYELDRQERYGSQTESTQHKEFTSERMTDAAAMLRDLWWTAWATSIEPESTAP